MCLTNVWDDGRKNQKVVTDISNLIFDPSFFSTVCVTALNLETIVRQELLEGDRINSFFLWCSYETAAERLSIRNCCGTPPISSNSLFNPVRKHFWFSASNETADVRLLYGMDRIKKCTSSAWLSFTTSMNPKSTYLLKEGGPTVRTDYRSLHRDLGTILWWIDRWSGRTPFKSIFT